MFTLGEPTYDGVCYSDVWLVRDELRHALVARGLLYLTCFCTPSGLEVSGDIVANSFVQAQQIAFGRGLDEQVLYRIERLD